MVSPISVMAGGKIAGSADQLRELGFDFVGVDF